MGNATSGGRVDDAVDMDDGGFLGGGRASSRAGFYARGSPPGSPHSPRMFVPQSPVTPLHNKAAEVHPMFNQILAMSGAQQQQHREVDVVYGSGGLPAERKIPTLLTWPLGGKDVYVEGTWDNWATKKPVAKSGKDHTILLMLPSGVHRYRFVVDGERRFVPDLPCETDNTGRVIANLVDVHDFIPDQESSIESVSELTTAPASPDSSYGWQVPGEKELAKEPPQLPAQLYLGVLNARRPRSSRGEEGGCARPRHVVLDHLYIGKGWGDQPLFALAYTHRFRSKYVTCVLYKAVERQ